MQDNLKIGLIRILYIWLTVFVGFASFPQKAFSLFSHETTFQIDLGLKEIDSLEYAVYTDFFNIEKLPPVEIPQFFKHAVGARKIFGNTITEKELKPDELSYILKSFGEAIIKPFEDYRKKNSEEYLVKDRIMVPGVTIFTKEQRDKLFSGGLSEVPSHVTGEYVSVSRIGFNQEKDTAFFKIIWNGSAVTSYYVMMQKKGTKWLIVNLIMDNMIIF